MTVMRLAFERRGDRKSRAERRRGILGRAAGADRLVGIGGALPDRGDVEAEHGGRQQADIGEHRKAPADPRMMVEELDALRLEEVAQGVPAPSLRGSESPSMISAGRARRPALSSAESTAIVCIRVSPVPPDFEIATKRVEASGSRCRTWSKVIGSRLSRKWMRGASVKRPAPGTA